MIRKRSRTKIFWLQGIIGSGFYFVPIDPGLICGIEQGRTILKAEISKNLKPDKDLLLPGYFGKFPLV